ncbi:MAG: hypothetical protein Q7R95_02355 [bacterium]|nr:hypothetical protein [bacterium]
MSLKFCPKCNTGTPQLDLQIKFCSNCGYNFISASMPKIEIEQIKIRPKQSIARQIEEDLEDNDGNISALEFEPPEIELDIPQRPKLTIGSLAIDKSTKENIIRPKLKKMNKKQFQEDWAKDIIKGESKEII